MAAPHGCDKLIDEPKILGGVKRANPVHGSTYFRRSCVNESSSRLFIETRADNPDIADTPSAVVYSTARSRLSIMSELSACRDNGLWSAASEQLHEDPKSGAIFAFINRERTRLKLLYWDGYATPIIM